jgi:DNA-binding LacI/PurR family transcriptional regulator
VTTIALPVREIALACASFLIRRTDGGERQDAAAYQATHRPTLVIRGSTAPPPR